MAALGNSAGLDEATRPLGIWSRGPRRARDRRSRSVGSINTTGRRNQQLKTGALCGVRNLLRGTRPSTTTGCVAIPFRAEVGSYQPGGAEAGATCGHVGLIGATAAGRRRPVLP